MSLDRRAIDQQLHRRTARRRQRLEDRFPDAFLGPADEAVVERLARAVDRRSIDPTAAGLENVNDTADDAAIIDPRLAARVGRKMRLKPRELSFGQPEVMVVRSRAPFGILESRNDRRAKTFYGSGT